MNPLDDYPLVFEQTIAWGDMDAFGHVNNVQYYRYIESARIAYMEMLNVFAADILTVVSHNQCQYMSPVYYPDKLRIGVQIVELRNSAFRMQYALYSEQQQTLVAQAEAVVVCVNKADLKKTQIPEHIKAKIKQLQPRLD